MNNKQGTIIEIDSDKYQIYVNADEEIKRRLGHSPGPEFLMSLLLESEDTDSPDIADIYCLAVLKSITAEPV
jgi:hypothetical protein